ncbi:histidine phosphatase family protein [Planktotalea arctica]|uniref:histidine phosphatase family protein n=1 Tax=Planktotalea arctica TaxID=1481893 RepID=UPI003219E370
MTYPTVYLLRHGQTQWNVAARLQGRLDSDLTEQGRAQALRQGALLSEHWGDLRAADILCSPLGRAQATAHLALDGLGAEFQADARLREITAGSWDGAHLDEIARSDAPLFEQARNSFELMFLAPDGEGAQAVIARCTDLLDALSKTSILFTHGATLCVLRGLLRGLTFEEMLDLSHEQGCIYRIENGVETILR